MFPGRQSLPGSGGRAAQSPCHGRAMTRGRGVRGVNELPFTGDVEDISEAANGFEKVMGVALGAVCGKEFTNFSG